MGELLDPAYADLAAVLRANDEFPGRIKGIKLRASVNALGDNAATVLPQAREAADALDVPLMVHVGKAPPTLFEVVPYMRAGDILTHCFHPHPGGGILDHGGRLRPHAREALDRGILLDVGHGAGSLSHETAIAAMEQGVFPDTISSDLHAENIQGPVIRSLLTVMEMFLALGMSVEDVFSKVTSAPAKALGRTDIGVLKPGAVADVAIYRQTQTERTKQDTTGHRITLVDEFVHQVTIAGGSVLKTFDDGRSESRKSPWLAQFGADMGAEN
jgi:dihydroorotase